MLLILDNRQWHRKCTSKIKMLMSAKTKRQKNVHWRPRFMSTCQSPYVWIDEEYSAASFSDCSVKLWFRDQLNWNFSAYRLDARQRGAIFQVAVARTSDKSSFLKRKCMLGTFCDLFGKLLVENPKDLLPDPPFSGGWTAIYCISGSRHQSSRQT